MADENGSWHKMSQDDTMAKNLTDVHAFYVSTLLKGT